jgi:hypothetical protein
MEKNLQPAEKTAEGQLETKTGSSKILQQYRTVADGTLNMHQLHTHNLMHCGKHRYLSPIHKYNHQKENRGNECAIVKNDCSVANSNQDEMACTCTFALRSYCNIVQYRGQGIASNECIHRTTVSAE